MRRFFYIAGDGLPVIVSAIALGALFSFLGGLYTGIPFFLFGLLAAVFFRDPERRVPDEPALALSPADGKIIEIADRVKAPGFENSGLEFKKVSIFMSVLNVHVNRIPWPGRVAKTQHMSGAFFHAGSCEAGLKNESNMLLIDDKERGYTFLVKQIAGVLARRIVCKAKEGDEVNRGDRFGMIKFGSRVELFMPKDFEFAVKIGDKVKGGLTPLGKVM